MKVNAKVLAAVLALGSFGVAPAAFAGEGGAAGAAAFTINPFTNTVTGAAVAAGVGKNNAAAAAFNNPGGFNSAYGVGASGATILTNIGNPFTAGISTLNDPNLGTPQANQLSPTTSIDVDAGGATIGL
ncbi:hypothetical protein [Lusitaniella coriacea]|uniref:hypothetical protein n=1 Tax=Lusitaniella coriacea TaxID=1983105 RepID=UPI003CF4B030